MSKRRAFLLVLAALLLLAALAGLWLYRPLPEAARLSLKPTAFAALPGWRDSDPRPALAAFRRSCTVLAARPPASAMGGAGYAGTAGDWQAACAAIPKSGLSAPAARAWFAHWFTPVQVFASGQENGLLTGYYEPLLAGSRVRTARFRTPVYGAPRDLVTADLGRFRPQWAHERLAGRLVGNRLVPYPDRAEIEAKGLAAAPVLFWTDDPVTLFFLQIQGSGRVRFTDGKQARIAYAAQNGRPYTAIGRTLIGMGAIPREAVSLQSIRAWLAAHPLEAAKVMNSDASFVFFRELPMRDPGLGASGTEGVPLTPQASLAVDPRIHPLGIPLYVAVTVPDAGRFDRLLVAQDTGGAIAGALRGDVFWGFGARAEAIAGAMKAHGPLYVLVPKPVAARWGGAYILP